MCLVLTISIFAADVGCTRFVRAREQWSSAGLKPSPEWTNSTMKSNSKVEDDRRPVARLDSTRPCFLARLLRDRAIARPDPQTDRYIAKMKFARHRETIGGADLLGFAVSNNWRELAAAPAQPRFISDAISSGHVEACCWDFSFLERALLIIFRL